MSIEIVRVTTRNYPEYLDMINWRVSGERASLLRQRGELKPYTKQELDYGGCLDTDYFWVYAGKISGEMVGYLQASLIPKPDKRIGTLFVDEVWTQESFRGQGVAKALVNKILKIGKEQNLWEVRLTVDIDNPAARRVYTSAGFIEKQCIFGRVRIKSN